MISSLNVAESKRPSSCPARPRLPDFASPVSRGEVIASLRRVGGGMDGFALRALNIPGKPLYEHSSPDNRSFSTEKIPGIDGIRNQLVIGNRELKSLPQVEYSISVSGGDILLVDLSRRIVVQQPFLRFADGGDTSNVWKKFAASVMLAENMAKMSPDKLVVLNGQGTHAIPMKTSL